MIDREGQARVRIGADQILVSGTSSAHTRSGDSWTASSRTARPPIYFHVHEMVCKRTAGAVTTAIKHIDTDARLSVDLSRQRIEIEPASCEPEAYRNAIHEAGYRATRRWPCELAYFLADPLFARPVSTAALGVDHRYP